MKSLRFPGFRNGTESNPRCVLALFDFSPKNHNTISTDADNYDAITDNKLAFAANSSQRITIEILSLCVSYSAIYECIEIV